MISTVGTVVAYEEHDADYLESSHTIYRPVVEFTPAGADSPIRVTAKGGQSYRIARVGRTVRVRYDPANPSNCSASTVLTRIALRLILAILVLMALSVLFLGHVL